MNVNIKMKLFKNFSLITKIFILATVTTYANANTYDTSEYKPIQLLDTNRKKLPEAVRLGLTPENLDVIERSPITVLSPHAKIGFKVTYEQHTILTNTSRKVEVECIPLNSGLLRCSNISKHDESLRQITYRGVYAFGGLVPIYDTIFNGEVEFNSERITNIRYKNNMQPSLPSPGIDVVFDFTSHVAGNSFYQIRCTKATENLTTPPVISEKGNVSLIACGIVKPPLFNPNNLIDRQEDRNYNPGVFGGALFFWIEEQGIALPASLFYPNQLKGSGTLGYYNIWRHLLGSSSSDSGVKIQNINFKWLQ